MGEVCGNCQQKHDGCIFENVHRRLEDVHTHWHNALSDYFDPVKFRASFQSCIVTLRSVTFVLKKLKSQIPNFDEWYAEWEAFMKQDTLMNWAKDSRNVIEKEGDLETHSRMTARFIAQYGNSLPEFEVKGGLFESIDSLFARLDQEFLHKQLLKHGTLKVERRWVANTLPMYELLDALSIVYGNLSLLLDEAHSQAGLPVPYLIHPSKDKVIPVAGGGPADGRLPCMIGSSEFRSILVSLKTGEPNGFTSKKVVASVNSLREVREHYGDEMTRRAKPDNSLKKIGEYYFDTARMMFLKDGYHQSILMLFRNFKPIKLAALEVIERSDKYLAMEFVATDVERTGADLVLMIGEAWYAEHDPLNPYLYPSDKLDRGEKLCLWATSEREDNFNLSAEIIRLGSKVSLKQTIEEKSFVQMFDPIRAVWRKVR